MDPGSVGVDGGLDGGSHHQVDLAAPRDGAVDDFAVADLAALRDLTVDLGNPVSSSPCLTGGSVVYVDGDPGDYIHPGPETFAVSAWTAINSGTADTFLYETNPNSIAGIWDFAFSSLNLGQPLAVGRYDNATGYPGAAGTPVLQIIGGGRACRILSGWFEIESIAGGPNNGSFTELTATFEQHCENAAAALRGCIHFEN